MASEASVATSTARPGEAEFRLDVNLVPRRYDLLLKPDAEDDTFAGSATIEVEVAVPYATPTRAIVLHALGLHVEPPDVRVVVQPHGGAALVATAIRADGVSETIAIEFAEPLPNDAGARFTLIIAAFTGKIFASSGNTTGMFHSHPRDRGFLTTHSEPTNARQLFPCFDEPHLKAVFRLTVEYDARYTVLSNTDVDFQEIVDGPEPNSSSPDLSLESSLHGGEEDGLHAPAAGAPRGGLTSPYATAMPRRARLSSSGGGGGPGESLLLDHTPATAAMSHLTLPSQVLPGQRRRVTFKETPVLSTYVIGFNTGKFHVLEQESKNRSLLCRVLFPSVRIGRGNNAGWYALDLLVKAVDFFESFFGVALPLEKLDLVGVVAFQLLGMENWGMINLNLDFMLVDERTTLERRQRIARLVGHEVAHMWYGNWVSVAEWKYLWLKEGMARFLEFHFVDSAFPAWMMWPTFLTTITDSCLAKDADLRRTHPVQFCATSPRQIIHSFDEISYGKGATLLRMLHTLLGMDRMKEVLSRLLTDFALRSFNADDFRRTVLKVVSRDRCRGDTNSSVSCSPAGATLEELVLASATDAGHPLLLLRRAPCHGGEDVGGGSGSSCSGGTGGGLTYVLSSYHMPDLVWSVLAVYVQRLRSAGDGTGGVDLVKPPPGTSFQWHPEELFAPSTYRTVVAVADVTSDGRGPTRFVALEAGPLRLGVARPEASLEPVLLLNVGGVGAMRCDYDHRTWALLFQHAPVLSMEDRITITMSLVQLQFIHVGQLPGDDGDRCTLLLEWLLRLMRGGERMATLLCSTLWTYVATHLEVLVYLVKDHYCWNLFAEFVTAFFRPLVLRGLVTFRATEAADSFESQWHLPRATVMRILHILAMCRCPLVADEARHFVDEALSTVIRTTATTEGGGRPPRCASTDVGADHLVPGAAATAEPAPTGDDGEEGETEAEATSTAGAASVAATAATSGVPRSPSATSSAPSPPRSLEIDVLDTDCAAAVTIAMQALVEQGDLDYWWRMACVLAKALGLPESALQSHCGDLALVDVSLDPHVLANSGSSSSITSGCAGGGSPQARQLAMAWVGITAPAVVAMEHPAALPEIRRRLLPHLGATIPIAKALLRNPTLLAAVLEDATPAPPADLLHCLAHVSKDYCSNGAIAASMRSRFTTPAVGHRGRLSTPLPGQLPPEAPRPWSSQLHGCFVAMERNCIWMDYVCEHYDQFLRAYHSHYGGAATAPYASFHDVKQLRPHHHHHHPPHTSSTTTPHLTRSTSSSGPHRPTRSPTPPRTCQ